MKNTYFIFLLILCNFFGISLYGMNIEKISSSKPQIKTQEISNDTIKFFSQRLKDAKEYTPYEDMLQSLLELKKLLSELEIEEISSNILKIHNNSFIKFVINLNNKEYTSLTKKVKDKEITEILKNKDPYLNKKLQKEIRVVKKNIKSVYTIGLCFENFLKPFLKNQDENYIKNITIEAITNVNQEKSNIIKDLQFNQFNQYIFFISEKLCYEYANNIMEIDKKLLETASERIQGLIKKKIISLIVTDLNKIDILKNKQDEKEIKKYLWNLKFNANWFSDNFIKNILNKQLSNKQLQNQGILNEGFFESFLTYFSEQLAEKTKIKRLQSVLNEIINQNTTENIVLFQEILQYVLIRYNYHAYINKKNNTEIIQDKALFSNIANTIRTKTGEKKFYEVILKLIPNVKTYNFFSFNDDIRTMLINWENTAKKATSPENIIRIKHKRLTSDFYKHLITLKTKIMSYLKNKYFLGLAGLTSFFLLRMILRYYHTKK